MIIGSNLYSIPGVIEAISDAKTILDIGAGSGKYAMLAHEYCRDLEHVDAIEPNLEYLVENTEWYRFVYNSKAQDTEVEEEYDIGLMVAVIGKLTDEQLTKVLKLPCKRFVVTVEKLAHGNDRQWIKSELRDFFPGYTIKELPSEWLVM